MAASPRAPIALAALAALAVVVALAVAGCTRDPAPTPPSPMEIAAAIPVGTPLPGAQVDTARQVAAAGSAGYGLYPLADGLQLVLDPQAPLPAPVLTEVRAAYAQARTASDPAAVLGGSLADLAGARVWGVYLVDAAVLHLPAGGGPVAVLGAGPAFTGTNPSTTW
jgi:hypothetical protein